MSSTNKTSHYNLSQYVGSDKPTYLADYNTDMSNIDTGIYGAKSIADTNTTNIGTLSNLTTTAKTSLVSAINEVDSNTDTNTSSIGTINSNIGTLSNLTTTAKNNLVSAINEVDAEADTNSLNIGTLSTNLGNISSLVTSDKTSVVNAINEIFNYLNLTDNRALSNPVVLNSSNQPMSGASVSVNNVRIALNSAGTYGKIYGDITITGITAFPRVRFANTGIKGVTQSFEIRGGALIGGANTAGVVIQIDPPATGETSASILLRYGTWDGTIQAFLLPCIYYFTDFGDVG